MPPLSPENIEALSFEEIRQVLHDLHVHQVELEMQNVELRTMQADLDAARARYFDLYDLAPVGYCTLSEKGMILEANLTAVTLLGLNRSALLKLPLTRYILPDDQNIYFLHRKQLFETGEPQTFDLRMLKKDGTQFWAHLAATAAQEIDSALVCRVVISDITERKQAENALTHSHDLMRYIIEHNRSAVAVHDRDLKYIYVSERYLDDYNVNVRDVIGKHHYDVFPDLPKKWRDVHQKALSGEISSAEDDPYVRDDGTVDWTRWECRPWYEANGSIGGIIIYTEVITERKKVEDALRKSVAQMRAITDSAQDAILMMDQNGRLSFWNPAAESIFGYTGDEAIGKNLHQLITVNLFYAIKQHRRYRHMNF